MKRGLKILLVLSLSFVMSAAFIRCGEGHAPQSAHAPSSNTTPTEEVILLSVTVTPANPSITLVTGGNQTEQFTATGNYSDGSTKDLTTSVAWSSSNSAVADFPVIVSSGDRIPGNASILSNGVTTISATSLAANVTESTTLTVVSST